MPPRPTFIALAALLTVAFILLLRPFLPPLSLGSSSYCDIFGCGRSLRAWLEEEEARYSETLELRQRLIQTWGPTEDLVES